MTSRYRRSGPIRIFCQITSPTLSSFSGRCGGRWTGQALSPHSPMGRQTLLITVPPLTHRSQAVRGQGSLVQISDSQRIKQEANRRRCRPLKPREEKKTGSLFPTGTVYGRSVEATKFQSILLTAESVGRTVLVVGPRGMGKSAILREFKRTADQSHLKCTSRLFLLSGTDDPDTFTRRLLRETFKLTRKADGRSWVTGPNTGEQLKALFGVVNADKLVGSLFQSDNVPFWEQLLELLKRLSEGMDPDRRIVLLVDPEPYFRQDSAAAWVAFVRRLPPKVVVVFAQRHDGILAQHPDFHEQPGVLDWIRANPLEEEGAEAFIDAGLEEIGLESDEAKSILLGFRGWPYQIYAGLLFLLQGGGSHELASQSDQVSETLLDQCGQVSEEALSLVNALAVMEVPVPVSLITRFLDTSVEAVRSLIGIPFVRGLVEESDGRFSLFHGLFTETAQRRIRADGMWHELHERSAHLYEAVLEDAPRDELALTRLTAHLREASDKSAFVGAVLELAEMKRNFGLISSIMEDLEATLGLPLEAGQEAQALGHLGILKMMRGEWDEAEQLYRRWFQIEQELGLKGGMASALGSLGMLHSRRGELDQAEEMYLKSLQINEELGRKGGMATDYGNLGNLHMTRGEWDQAEEMYLKSLQINEEVGRKEGMADNYGNLGILYRCRGELGRAEEMHRKSLQIEQELGRKEGMASDYGNLGNLYLARGEWDQAEEMYLKSLQIEQELGRKEGMGGAYGSLGLVYKDSGELDRAEEMYQKSLQINEELGSKNGLAHGYGNLGNLCFSQGRIDEAEELLLKALKMNEEIGRREGMAIQYGNLGNVHFVRQEWDQAEEMYRRSLQINEELGRKEGMAHNYRNLGNLYETRGELDQAEEMYRKSRELSRGLSEEEG